MRGQLVAAGVVAVVLVVAGSAQADVNPIVVKNLTPIQDTYATHDDGMVHGFETFIRVGIEPQQCVAGGYDPCEDKDQECCNAGSDYNYCAEPGQCQSTNPSWTAFRKYRGYLRFDLNSLPEGKVISASLRLTEVGKVAEMGGSFKLKITALKQIGLEEPICEWFEQTLNDTNGTTWSSLPQNVSVTQEGMWFFDVTKALTDWVNGEQDKPDTPIKANCGFHLYDDDFGNANDPIQRWVDFGSKESGFGPQLKVEIAQDLDNDGYFGDCDEENADINPGATEVCDEIDNDCDGKVDEENCDGLDNDCDGLIDEGEDLCGEGQMCIYHQCYASCEDDCGGTTKLKCVKNEESGLYERWGCKKDADDDPCFDWYKAEDCEAGDFCQYGYCSSNCVDLCDVEGLKECEKDSLGIWHVGTCKDSDGDGCLDLYDNVPCGPSASCENATCGTPCADDCVLGDVVCNGAAAIDACYDWDDDGCLEMAQVASCDPGVAPCEDGECGGQPIPCEDDCLAGAFMCEVEDGVALLFECVKDQDEDVCLEWGNVSECPPPGQCNPMKNGCLEDEPVVENEPDVFSPPEDILTPEVVTPADVPVATDLPAGEDLPAAPDGTISADLPASDNVWGPDLAGATEAEPKKKDDGCNAGETPSVPAAFLLLAALALILRRRWAA